MPQLRVALDRCRRFGATLLIAKLDRLARNVQFVSGLPETGVDFVAADPLEANKVMLQIYSVTAGFERDRISARTKAALAAANAPGVVLGAAGARNRRPSRGGTHPGSKRAGDPFTRSDRGVPDAGSFAASNGA